MGEYRGFKLSIFFDTLKSTLSKSDFRRSNSIAFSDFSAHVALAAKSCVCGNIGQLHAGISYKLTSSCAAYVGKIFTG